MSSVYYRRPQVEQRAAYGGSVPRFDTCIHVHGKTEKLCGNPTENGSQRCEKCKQRSQVEYRSSRFSGVRPVFADN